MQDMSNLTSYDARDILNAFNAWHDKASFTVVAVKLLSLRKV